MDRMNEMKVVEPGIVPIYEDKEERRLVNARELWIFIESKREFATWIKNRIDKYGFVESVDFTTFDNLVKRSNGGGSGAILKEYLITVDVAMELATVENNAKGRQVRKYFIECEKRLKAVSGAISARDAEKLKQQSKRLEIMNRSSRNRQAQILKSVAEFFKDILPTFRYRQKAADKIREVLDALIDCAGEMT